MTPRLPRAPIVATAKRRATFLGVDDVRMLNDWCAHLRRMFNGDTPYLVGSALARPDYRDVDVRLLMEDDAHASLAAVLNIPRLNVTLSLWGKQATGLPIDCQVQQRTFANATYGGPRHPLGFPWDDNPKLALG